MPVITSEKSSLLVIDFQQRLMPAIDQAEAVLANAKRLLDAAHILDIPVTFTEQNPKGLGGTVRDLPTGGASVLEKMHFDASRAPDASAIIPFGTNLVVAGCEAHVCVLQSVLGLLAFGRRVIVVADATGSRVPANKQAAIDRMRDHGAEILTTEMVIFEWLQTADHPMFKDVIALIK